MTKVTINIAKQFSKYPAGRYRNDSRYSAEELRDDHLSPVIEDGHDLVVNLDGLLGLPSSFCEEAFGGLVRKHGPEVIDRVSFQGGVWTRDAEHAERFMAEAAARIKPA